MSLRAQNLHCQNPRQVACTSAPQVLRVMFDQPEMGENACGNSCAAPRPFHAHHQTAIARVESCLGQSPTHRSIGVPSAFFFVSSPGAPPRLQPGLVFGNQTSSAQSALRSIRSPSFERRQDHICGARVCELCCRAADRLSLGQALRRKSVPKILAALGGAEQLPKPLVP